MYQRYVKRLLDISLSIIMLLISSPVLLIVTIAIKIESPGSVIFKQTRLGRYGNPFIIYKFRSMCVNAEKTGTGQYSFKNDPRVTKVGRIIRALSIDELPQVFNIIKGDMSLIGFRPPLTYHPWPFEEYTQEQKKMFNVRPGITGWAQIHGRKDVQWSDRIEMGIYYAENVSFLLDLRIFFITIWKVVSNADNENTNITVQEKEKSASNTLQTVTSSKKN